MPGWRSQHAVVVLLSGCQVGSGCAKLTVIAYAVAAGLTQWERQASRHHSAMVNLVHVVSAT
jgi:hypothetical protein